MLIKSNESNRVIELAKYDAIQLEVKFNLTNKGREWSHIGDALYYSTNINVSDIQFVFLHELLSLHNIQFVMY